MSDRLSFEEAANELGISSTELEGLVADGQIAAEKEGDTFYFSRDAVETYKSQTDDPAILLSDEEINLLDDDDDIDLGIDLEESVSVTASSDDATDDLSLDTDDIDIDLGGDTADLDETIVSTDVLDDEGSTPMGDSLLEDDDLGDDTLLDTDVLDLSDDDDTDTFELDTAEETLLDADEEGTLLRGGGARVMQMKRKSGSPAFTALLAVACLLLILPLSVLMSTVYAQKMEGVSAESAKEQYAWVRDYNFLRPVVDIFAKPFQ